jgi:hypothetical protein
VFIKTIFKGAIGSVETWSTSISWGVFGLAADTPDQGEADGLLAALRASAAVTTPPNALRTLMSTGVNLNAIRLERRAEDETVLNVAEGLLTTPTSGLGTATKTPQDSLVFSLRTTTPGPKGRGRLYWPAVGATLSASYQLSAPTAATVATDAQTWLKAIGLAMNGYWASVSSVRTAVLSVRSVTDHVCRDVNQLQIGSVLDTQRRRRDSLPETYTSVTYP